MDKNRAFSQRLRQSVKDYFDAPWMLTYADAERLLDMRDEALVLRDDEVTGIVPEEMEFEELDLVNDQLAEQIAAMLQAHKETGAAINLSLLLKDYLAQHPHAQHFDMARLVIDQAVRLGYSESDFNAIQPDWEAINDYGARYKQMSLTNIEEFMPEKLAKAIANPLFPALDNALRSGRHISSEDLDNHALLIEFEQELAMFYKRYNAELVRAPEGFFYLRPRSTSLISRSVLTELDMLVGKVLCFLYLSPERLAHEGIFTNQELFED